MRHRKSRLQLNRFTSWRKATLVSLAKNLFIHQSIKTSKARAKAVRPLVERLISLAKSNTVTRKRQVFRVLQNHKLVSLLFNEIAPRFVNKISGYTRIVALGTRRGDNAEIAILELTEIKKKEVRKPKKAEEIKPEEEKKEVIPKEKAIEERPPISKKPTKKFLAGLRKIFKKERDSL